MTLKALLTSLYFTTEFVANFKFRNTDDTPITDATTFVELRKDDASGPVIPLSEQQYPNGLSINFILKPYSVKTPPITMELKTAK